MAFERNMRALNVDFTTFSAFKIKRNIVDTNIVLSDLGRTCGAQIYTAVCLRTNT